MALHKNADYILFMGCLIVTFVTLPLVSTENIDCKGKAFHCVNSTHFKICVDFGGGISKTVDEFLIPCPTNTVCRDINKFECEHQVTTTLGPIGPSDVTNEQAEQSVTSVGNEVDVTTLFPKNKTNKIEEFKNYESSATTTKSISSADFSDSTDYISLTTVDGRLNHVTFGSENNELKNDKSDLSESATVSYVLTSSVDSNNDEFLTTTSKVTVKDTLLNISLHTNTTSINDLSLATTVQILEGVTERNIGLVQSVNSSYFSNINEYKNTNNTLSTLDTEINSMFNPSEIFENTTPYSIETLSVTNNPRNDSDILTTLSNLNIENVANDSTVNLSNSFTTTDLYNLDREQTTKTDSSAMLYSTYNSELFSKGSTDPFTDVKFNFTVGSTSYFVDDVTTPNIQDYTPIESSTNVFNADNKTNINDDTNGTETLFTVSSIINEFPSTESVKESFKNTNVNLIIESSTPSYSVDNLTTPTTDNDLRQSVEKDLTSAISSTDLYFINTRQINDSADISPKSNKPYVVISTVSNPTKSYAGPIVEYLFNSTINTNKSLTDDLLKSNTSSDRPFLDPLPLKSIINNVQKPLNDTVFVENETTVMENLSAATTLFVESNNITTPTQLNLNSMLDTSTPLINLFNSNTDIDLQTRTTLQYPLLQERYQSITSVNPKVYRNQENRYSLSTSQTFDVKETETVSTTTILSGREIITIQDKKLASISYLAYENMTKNAALSISNKNDDNLNLNLPSVIATTETSIYALTTQSLIGSSKTHLNETMFRTSNITDKYNMFNTIKEQVQTPANRLIIDNFLPTTHINEEYEVFNISLKNLNNVIINNRITTEDLITKTTFPVLKEELVTLKSYENKTKTNIKTNEIITTTESDTFDVNSNLFSPGQVEFTKTYSEIRTQNIFDTTNVFHKENVTHSNIDNLFSVHYNTPKNMSKVQDFNIGNKDLILEEKTINHSSSLSKKLTDLPNFKNVFKTKSLDLTSDSKSIAQTISPATISDKNCNDTLRTKSSYVNVSDEWIQYTTINPKNVILNNASTDDHMLTLQNKSSHSFELSQNLKSSINETAVNYNHTLLKDHVINTSNEEKKREAASSNYDNFSKNDRLQETYYKNNIKNQHTRISTDTEESFSTEVMPKAPHLSNQTRLLTEQFTCRDRGKYSDKNNCNKFYICIGTLQPIIGMCPANTVFSEINKQCTKNLSHCIRNNQFRCLSSGRFIDVLSEEFYYLCVKKLGGYVRFKLQCQAGYHLNKENIQCSSDTISAENISKTISDKSTNEKKSKEIKHLHKYEFDCEKEGKFEHPNDCRKYFVCTKSSEAKFRRRIKKCDSDEVFNKEKRKCVDSESYEC